MTVRRGGFAQLAGVIYVPSSSALMLAAAQEPAPALLRRAPAHR